MANSDQRSEDQDNGEELGLWTSEIESGSETPKGVQITDRRRSITKAIERNAASTFAVDSTLKNAHPLGPHRAVGTVRPHPLMASLWRPHGSFCITGTTSEIDGAIEKKD